MKKNQMVMKRIVIIILLLLGGLSYTGCYGNGLRGIFKRNVTIKCYRSMGSFYPWDTCIIDMVDGYYAIKDTLKSEGTAYMVSKIDSTMEFFYRIENKSVCCYRTKKRLCGNGVYVSRGPKDYFFEVSGEVAPDFNSFLGEFQVKK